MSPAPYPLLDPLEHTELEITHALRRIAPARRQTPRSLLRHLATHIAAAQAESDARLAELVAAADAAGTTPRAPGTPSEPC